MDKDTFLRKIDTFFEGRLSDENLKAFEKYKKEHPEMEAEINLRKKIHEAVILHSRKEKYDRIASIKNTMHDKGAFKNKMTKWIWPSIATAALFIGYLFFTLPSKTLLFQGKIEVILQKPSDILGAPADSKEEIRIYRSDKGNSLTRENSEIMIFLKEGDYDFEHVQLEYLDRMNYLLILGQDSLFIAKVNE